MVFILSIFKKSLKQLKTRLVEFLVEKGEGSESYISNDKVLLVTSDKDHKANILKLPLVDNIDEPVEWIISVAMLTEGWDVKNVFQIEHTRHRSPINGFINIIAGLIAFTHHDKKPQLDIDVCNIAQLIS